VIVKKSFSVPLIILLLAIIISTGCSNSVITPAPSTSSATTQAPSVTSKTSVTSTSAPAPVTSTGPAPGQPVYGGRLRFMFPFSTPNPNGWPPAIAGTRPYYMMPVFENLWTMDLDFNLHPVLAESWDITKEAITFHLRKGVKFHDGTDWNAEACKFGLEAWRSAKKPGTSSWGDIDVIDNYTLKLNLNEFQNTLLQLLADVRFSSPTAYQEQGEEWVTWHPIGTGPFKFKSYQDKVNIVYERFDDYWGDKPYLDEIEIMMVLDPMTEEAAMRAGQADVLLTMFISVVADLRDIGFNLISSNEGHYVLAFDSNNPDSPFADKRVREAVNYAIDREAIVQAEGRGIWAPLYQFCSSDFFGYNADLPGRHYDPEKAKQLLADAGYGSGFKTTLSVGNTEETTVLAAIQDYLSKVGIEVQLNVLDGTTLTQMKDRNGWDGLISNARSMWGGNVILYAQSYYGRTGTPSVKRPDGWMELLDKALAAQDTKTMQELGKQLVKMEYEEMMTCPIRSGGSIHTALTQDTVHDLGLFQFANSFQWTPGKAWIEKK
jgi:ABC-type transport system substrate-binding protein